MLTGSELAISLKINLFKLCNLLWQKKCTVCAFAIRMSLNCPRIFPTKLKNSYLFSRKVSLLGNVKHLFLKKICGQQSWRKAPTPK